MNPILKYFPEITQEQKIRFEGLHPLYREWNAKINVISRKDIDQLYCHHVLHSLSIAKINAFQPGARILDVGTGGGFPGIPLAILFPEAEFLLSDSIGKKLKLVEAICQSLELKNVKTYHGRAESIPNAFDFVVSRAVTTFPEFVRWVRNKFLPDNRHALPNGILYLKGGDLSKELKDFSSSVRQFSIHSIFPEPFFETKKVIYLPVKS